VCIETYAHKHKNTKKHQNKMQIIGRVAQRRCRFPPHQPPPLIRTSAAAVDYVKQQTATGMDLNV
jgi:hypothetical protein